MDNKQSQLSQANHQIKIQVVLEYQGTSSTPDLISDVLVAQLPSADGPSENEDRQYVSSEVPLKSLVAGLAEKGFDLEADQKLFYKDPCRGFNVHIGKLGDPTSENFKVPVAAFVKDTGASQSLLTLVVRQANAGLSGHKTLYYQQSFGAERVAPGDPVRRNLFASGGKSSLASAAGKEDIAAASQFARQQHELLASQSFTQGRTNSASSDKQLSTKQPKLTRGQTVDHSSHPPQTTAAYAANCEADIKRTKERQIRFVVERVSLWRKLYNGVELGNGETVRYSLEDSARLVGISKKSLDDYLLQLRFGRMYGFDFLKHQCDNIGVLRKFVREHKSKNKRERGKQAQQHTETETSQDKSKEEGAGIGDTLEDSSVPV